MRCKHLLALMLLLVSLTCASQIVYLGRDAAGNITTSSQPPEDYKPVPFTPLPPQSAQSATQNQSSSLSRGHGTARAGALRRRLVPILPPSPAIPEEPRYCLHRNQHRHARRLTGFCHSRRQRQKGHSIDGQRSAANSRLQCGLLRCVFQCEAVALRTI